ncbi:MAG: hypothetical protein IPK77_03525 [Cellvibrio sp.]|nr:hypothetical protein [Cellvibrio sp.]
MKFSIAFACIFLCACSHTERKIDFVDVNIPEVHPSLELTEILVVEHEPSIFPVTEVQYVKAILPFGSCLGVYSPEPKLITQLSLEELEKNYGALVVTNSYKKWIPIEGEPETILVFNFNK